jgi:hypothetical protein
MRTTNGINENERAAYQAFCLEHRIALDGEAGEKNGELFGDLIGARMNADFTQETLQTALTQLKSRLKFVSENYSKADELARNLSREEQETYRAWAKNQKLLVAIDGSEEGYQNVKSLLEWMRGSAVTARSLDLALGNLINNPKPGQRIHFHPQPKSQDRSVVQGRANHAFAAVDEPKPKAAAGIQQQEFVNGRRNHGYIPPEEATKKVTAQAPLDAWQEIINIQLKDWVTANQQVRLENEYKAGLASGKSLRDISSSLAVMVKDRHRGR